MPCSSCCFCYSILMIMMIQARKMWWFADWLWLRRGGRQETAHTGNRCAERLCVCHIELLCIPLIVWSRVFFFHVKLIIWYIWYIRACSCNKFQINACLLHWVCCFIHISIYLFIYFFSHRFTRIKMFYHKQTNKQKGRGSGVHLWHWIIYILLCW